MIFDEVISKSLNLVGNEEYKQCAVVSRAKPGIGRTRVEANHFQKKIKKI